MKKTALGFVSSIALVTLCSCSLLQPKSYACTKLDIIEDEIRLAVDETETLSYVVEPDSAINKNVDWSIEDASIAKINSLGIVKAVSVGTTYAVATTTDGSKLTDKCKVIVTAEAIKLSSISLSNIKETYNLNETFVAPTVTAIYSDTSTSDVTGKTLFEGYNTSVPGYYTVLVSYTEKKITKTTSFDITVKNADGTLPDPNTISKTEMNYCYKDVVDNNIYPIDSAPTKGEVKLLVIPVWFTDSNNYITTSKKSTVLADINTAYFGSNEATGWRSVKTYYEEESHHKLSLTGTVSDWYEVGTSSNTYYTDYYDNGRSGRTSDLVKTATDWYFENNPSESRRDYDSDKNGFLDGVMLIYAAPDQVTLKDDEAENLWAYCFWRQSGDASKTSPNPNVFFWASYDFMYDSSTAQSHTGKKYGYGNCANCNIDAHTFIHEMGHVFGLQDYYDYSNYGYSPAGNFSMQDHNVGGHDPYSVMAYGWANPYIPTTTTTITIGSFVETGDLILLSSFWNDIGSPFDEYLLLELFTPTGLNEFDCLHDYSVASKGPKKVGIRLWHIDARLVSFSVDRFGNPISNGLTSNPKDGYVREGMSNTYYDGTEESMGRISPLGIGYANYNIVQLIRNNVSETYKPDSQIMASDLFVEGDEFTMNLYKSQFVNSGKLNSNKTLGWSFSVDSMTNASATITVTRG